MAGNLFRLIASTRKRRLTSFVWGLKRDGVMFCANSSRVESIIVTSSEPISVASFLLLTAFIDSSWLKASLITSLFEKVTC
jgi:hypothetical protein